MSEKKLSSRERIVQSALALFASEGITAATTKQIAEEAGVNEVTLFRQFGSKQGLLLAVLQEATILAEMQAALTEIEDVSDPLLAYGEAGLGLLGQVPELVRSLIGEASQSPPENRQALALALRQANQQTVSYLETTGLSLPGLGLETAAGLLNTLILGHAVLDFTSEGHGLWPSQDEFLAALTSLFLGASKGTAGGVTDQTGPGRTETKAGGTGIAAQAVIDLPAETVRSLFQTAKKQDAQAYALVYVLFGAGLTLSEAVNLRRSHSLSSKNQHLLTLTGSSSSAPRQVPLNRWIMGHRYGTYQRNPLTQWLKNSADDQPAIFVTEAGTAMSETELLALWAQVAAAVSTPTGTAATPFQARQTWCIELLMKGISLENLSILSGFSLADLAPYAHRAKEKVALEQALAIDQKNS